MTHSTAEGGLVEIEILDASREVVERIRPMLAGTGVSPRFDDEMLADIVNPHRAEADGSAVRRNMGFLSNVAGGRGSSTSSAAWKTGWTTPS
jgi:hypothetical protein